MDVLVSQLISTTGSRIAKLLDVDSVVHPTMRYGSILRHGDPSTNHTASFEPIRDSPLVRSEQYTAVLDPA